MARYRLVLGNMNYSSWSLRAWLPAVQCTEDVETVIIPLDMPDTRQRILKYSPAGKVPVLIDGDLIIWDSLAIGEYLAEQHPEAGLLPADSATRARARSVIAEMHSGFTPLRKALPMNLHRKPTPISVDSDVQADIDRIVEIWTECRAAAGDGGPFLFGAPGLADAFYAPVATRFASYAIELPSVAQAYVDAIHAWPAFKRWQEDGLAEDWIIAREER